VTPSVMEDLGVLLVMVPLSVLGLAFLAYCAWREIKDRRETKRFRQKLDAWDEAAQREANGADKPHDT
jgi:hypothetical protein